MCRWPCDVTRIDRVRNEDIKERMGVTNIGVRCRRARLRWFGHVKRREENYVGRRMLSMVPPATRGSWRLRQRWMVTINADMRSVGAREEDTQGREIWKSICRTDSILNGRSLKKEKKKKILLSDPLVFSVCILYFHQENLTNKSTT